MRMLIGAELPGTTEMEEASWTYFGFCTLTW